MNDLTAAVEAGARAMFDRDQATRRDDGRKRPDGQPWLWEDLPAHDQHALRSFVLPIVIAAVTATEDAARVARLVGFEAGHAEAMEEAARDRAAVERVRNLVGDWQANGGSRALSDPTDRVWYECARQLLDALAGESDQPEEGA